MTGMIGMELLYELEKIFRASSARNSVFILIDIALPFLLIDKHNLSQVCMVIQYDPHLQIFRICELWQQVKKCSAR